ncbi:hypothetical protein W97_05922 [Coniosporium apollinis CBS 100218]|uniref:Uncharacterized protein n=1 Tax=Coniosporium apollinis (strain CBS 100218) TaxID=1168221 RepID=R7YYF8_CONA1|nr:uncharacterized protein W97_05922 [Coniosporium apollinis CBS 100218]EON66676.1 hypothetical protein W97_05922 [Coniosporium apollinis CBS 100218]
MDQRSTPTAEEWRQMRDNNLHGADDDKAAYIAYSEGSYPGEKEIAIDLGKDDSAASGRDTYCQCDSDPQAASVDKQHCQWPDCRHRYPAGLNGHHAGPSSGTTGQVQLPSIRPIFSYEHQPQTTADGYGGQDGEQAPDNDEVGDDDAASLRSFRTIGRPFELDVSSDEASVTEPPVDGQDHRDTSVAQNEYGGQVPTGPHTWSPCDPYDSTAAYQACDRQYYSDPEQP